ncbi:MAG TPA: sugar phosphate isomerase/epimerase [Clostridiales bacterium]|nr:sugar phosphate isomerase/epimerase [Clostridiales bacterium]
MKSINRQQLAIGNYPYPLYPFTYFLDAAEAFQIRNIEIWAAGPHLYLEDYSNGMIKQLKQEMAVRQLHAICLTPEQCMYPVNLGAREKYIRDRSIKYFEKALNAAEILDAGAVLVTPGDSYRNEGTGDAYAYTVENIRRLGEIAASKNLKFYLEHLTKETTSLATTAKELWKMKCDIGLHNVICMMDTDMMSRYGETTDDYLKETHGQLGHVHFIDGMPSGHLALGDGVLPLRSYLDSLNEAKYQGYLTLEILNDRYYLNPNAAVQKSIEWFDNYIRN